MALTRSERFKLKGGIRDEMQRDDQAWDFTKQNMLLREFSLQTMSGYNNGPDFEDLVADLPDRELVEMCPIVTGIEQSEVRDVVEAADAGNWEPGYVKLFISQSAAHKEFMGKVADELAVVGIHGFIAHDTMQVSSPGRTRSSKRSGRWTHSSRSCIPSSTRAAGAIRRSLQTKLANLQLSLRRDRL